jgi:hypothetical protein
MRILSAFLLGGALLLASGAWAGGNTGYDWDDSHMRSRFVSSKPAESRQIIVGTAETSTTIPETLKATSWRSWAVGGPSISFGQQAPRRSGGSSLSGLAAGRSGGTGGGGSNLGPAGGRGLSGAGGRGL